MFNFRADKPADSEIKKLLIRARHAPSTRERDAAKVELFEACGATVLRCSHSHLAVIRYKNPDKSYLLTEEDVVVEAWVIFQKAINNFGRLNKKEGRRNGEFDDYDIDYDYRKNGFVAYLTKTLQRQLSRQYDKVFGKGEESVLVDGEIDYHRVAYVDDSEVRRAETFDVEREPERVFGLTPEEGLIYRARVGRLPTKRFLELYPEVSYGDYYDHLHNIRIKVAAVLGREVPGAIGEEFGNDPEGTDGDREG